MKTILTLSLMMLSLIAKPNIDAASRPLHADCHSCSNKYSAKDLVGTYIRTTGTTTDDFNLNQLTLNANGTVYFYQSIAFQHLVTEGSFIPYTGTWKIKGDYVYLTVYSTDFFPVVLEPCYLHDIETNNWTRRSEKLKIADKCTLISEFRILFEIPLGSDPLTTPGVEIGRGTTPGVFKKVKVVFSDFSA